MTDRLPEAPGQWVDRAQPLAFTYDQKSISALQGDTVATALFAAGIRVMADSFKYHRPRGLMELGVHAADPMMTVDGRYNTGVARCLVENGMQVEPQFKSGMDVLRLADKSSFALQIGFYYKNASLYKSKTIWNQARKMMRTAPGNLGQIQTPKTKSEVDEVQWTPELLVVGGGLAGMEAALAGARVGIRVVLVEAEPRLGGFDAFQGPDHQASIRELETQLAGHRNLTVLCSTTAAMLYPDGLVVCLQSGPSVRPYGERSHLIRPKAIVFATGTMDRPMVFQHNDRPGVMLPRTAQRLIHLYGIRPGKRVVLAGGDDHIYQVALDLAGAGVEVLGLADQRGEGVHEAGRAALTARNIPFWPNSYIVEAKGKNEVSGAVVADGGSGREQSLKCNLIVAGSGITPLFKLAAQAEAEIVYDPELRYHLPVRLQSGHAVAGRLTGLTEESAIRAQGRWAAAAVLAHLGLTAAPSAEDMGALAQARRAVNPPQNRASKGNDRRFICLGNDVTEKDLDMALDEGFNHLEMIKRYSTATMGPEQGGLSQANFLDYLAHRRPDAMGEQKINTPRPPLVGVSMAIMAGAHHDAPKTTPLHRVQLAGGGRTVRTGPWLRIDHFGDPEGESLALHQSAALVDVSTLGKFRLFGPDAAQWFNRINTKSIDRLKNGKVLYFAVVNEEGVVIDDGIAVKWAENDYYFTSSTARSASVQPWYRNFKNNGWKAWLVTQTDAFAGMNLCGPQAREILARLTPSDVSNQALPFMNWTRAVAADVPVMIFRLGFLGETSFEIHCPSSQAEHLWTSILKAGQDLGLRPAGLETQFICRLEKGHVLPGLDTDGNTNLFEAHFGWARDKKNPGHVGGPMVRMLEAEPHKCRTIGFSLPGRAGIIDGHLVVKGPRRLGYVTSTRYSPVLDQTIGLALVETGTEADADFAPGGTVGLWLDGKEIPASYVTPPFYDPEGGRMKS